MSQPDLNSAKEYLLSFCEVDTSQCRIHGSNCDCNQPDCCYSVVKIVCSNSLGEFTSNQRDVFLTVTKNYPTFWGLYANDSNLVLPMTTAVRRNENSDCYLIVHDGQRSFEEKMCHDKMIEDCAFPTLDQAAASQSKLAFAITILKNASVFAEKIRAESQKISPQHSNHHVVPPFQPKSKAEVENMQSNERGKYFDELEDNGKNLSQIENEYGFKRNTVRSDIDAYRESQGLSKKVRSSGQPPKKRK